MGNTHQTGVKKDDQFPAGAAERAPNQLHPLGGDGGGHDFQATSMSKNCKKTSVTDGGGGRSRTESPPSLLFVLNTLPVNPRCVGDGDGFIVDVEKAAVVAVDGYKMAGDTNNRDPQQYRIRMRGIDAPELKMEYGVESKNELVKLIGGKRVTISVYGKDQYERYIGDVYCDGVFIEEQMLKGGFAWHYKKYDKRPELAQWEREARTASLGLWSSDNPQKPWEWRRGNPRNHKKDNVDDSQHNTVRRCRRSPPGQGMCRKSAEERGGGVGGRRRHAPAGRPRMRAQEGSEVGAGGRRSHALARRGQQAEAHAGGWQKRVGGRRRADAYACAGNRQRSADGGAGGRRRHTRAGRPRMRAQEGDGGADGRRRHARAGRPRMRAQEGGEVGARGRRRHARVGRRQQAEAGAGSRRRRARATGRSAWAGRRWADEDACAGNRRRIEKK